MLPGRPAAAVPASGGPATWAGRGSTDGRLRRPALRGRTTPRPSGRPATTRTSPTGSTACRRRTRWPTPSGSSPTRGAAWWPASAPGSPSPTPPRGELLGSVSLDLFAERQAAEIGYWIKREARRRGVALGAARLVIDWAFGELGVERLELLTYPGNEASQALAARLGFTRECLLRGFLAPEPGKSREGRVVPSADGSLPPRDDQVQFVRLRSDAPRLPRLSADRRPGRVAWR